MSPHFSVPRNPGRRNRTTHGPTSPRHNNYPSPRYEDGDTASWIRAGHATSDSILVDERRTYRGQPASPGTRPKGRLQRGGPESARGGGVARYGKGVRPTSSGRSVATRTRTAEECGSRRGRGKCPPQTHCYAVPSASLPLFGRPGAWMARGFSRDPE